MCCSALFMTLLDVSITNVALPSISDSTGAGPSQLQWIVSGYTLAFGLVPVLAGRLGDDHGRRRMFQIGVAGFAVTSAALRAGADGGAADRRPAAPGDLRRPDQPAGLRPGPADVPRRGAGPRLRRARHDGRSGHGAGPARRRRADRPRRPRPRLAAGVLRQRPGRDRGDRPGPALPAADARDRPAPARRARFAHPRAGDVLRAVRRRGVRGGRAGPSLLLAVPAVVLLFLFWRRERRLTDERHGSAGRPAAVPAAVVHLGRGAGAALLPRAWPDFRW